MKGCQEVCQMWEFQTNNNYNNLVTGFNSSINFSPSLRLSQPDVCNTQYRSGSGPDMNSNPTISGLASSGDRMEPLLQPCVDANLNQEPSDSNTWTNFHFKTMERWASINKRTKPSKATTGVQTDDSSFDRDVHNQRCRRHRLRGSHSSEEIERPHSGGSDTHGTRDLASSCSKSSTFMQFRRNGLPHVHFPKWSKLGKKSNQLLELTEAYIGRYYRPFSSVRKQIAQQARDVLFTRFGGDFTLFEENYLKPLANCLRTIQDTDENILPSCRRKCGGRSRNNNKKITGWPLCTRGFVIVHLTHLDPTLLTQTGDFYIVAEDPPSVSVVYRDRGTLYRQALDGPQFISFMAGILSSESNPPEDEEEEDIEDSVSVEKELFQILGHLMVSSERGTVQRIELGQVAKDLWKFEGPVVRRSRHRFRSTRDSWVQTLPPEELDASLVEDGGMICSPHCSESLAPLASEEEFCSDTEVKHKHNKIPPADNKYPHPAPTPSLDGSCEDLSGNNLLAEPSSISDLADNVVMSRIAILPGSRDLYGRSVLFLSLEQIKKFPTVTPIQVAQLILYFQSVPKRDVMNLGFLIVVDGREAAVRECCFLEKILSYVETSIPRTVSLVLTYQNQNQKSIVPPTSLLHRSHTRFEVLTNVNQLLKYIRRNQLLPEYGGTYTYDHDEWITYHKFLDPFVNGCRMTGRHLLTVMQDLRNHQLPSSSSLSSQMIEHHKKQIMEALEDEQLRHLEEEGNSVLEELEAYHKKSPHNHDYRDSVEKCSLFYEQLKKILLRLTKLADKRLGRLQECMMMKTFEEESSQVLSWLCHKGNETLKKHKILAENVSGIREQENEFEKFYFLAMRQIERGNDLLDDTPKPKVVSATGINSRASVLKNQLEEFTEKLEDARERLEDTSCCYNLLDKSYEWALETMRFVSHMKFDSSTSLESLVKILKQLEEYLKENPPISEETFQEMISLAQKLQNERLLEQCQIAKTKCLETAELIQTRLMTLHKAKDQMEVTLSSKLSYSSSSVQSNPFVWMPVVSSTPYRSPSQSFLHGPNSLYGSQQILREATGSYTSFPSSYYPAAGLKDNRIISRKEFLLKGSLVTEDLTGQQLLTALPSRSVDHTNISGVHRKSYPWGSNIKSSSASDGSKSNLNDCVSIASSVQDLSSVPLVSSSRSWKMCEEALNKAAEKVREQNVQLQLQQSVEGVAREEDLFDEEIDTDKACQSPTSSSSKPAPVNMHLLRCASCSDFEELLSTKNAELEAQRKSKKLLKLIMREMIQTERDYVKSLEYIIENYVPLFQKSDIPQALRGQRNVLFGNIEKIYEFHSCYFLQELEQCDNSPYSVGQCFLKYEPQFYLYALYNKNKPKSDDLMAEYGNSFCKQKQQELGDKMDLASYLLKPVQRMGKYALLLKQLLKECPERDCDYNDLKAAEEMVHFQLRHGNDLLAMDALRDCDVNVKEQGRLLRQDEFLVWQGKSRKALRHMFLFEDLILFGKARRDPERKGHDFYQYKNSIKTTDIGLTEQVGESPTKFEIWFRKRKTHDIYTLQAPSAEVKKAWVQDISKLLWKQALRNRELRLAEMSSMGIGNKPCLDISPSRDQICDRSISFQHLNKAPRFRNSIAITGCDNFSGKRPNSIISMSSNSSSGSSSSSAHPVVCVPTTLLEAEESTNKRLSVAQQSQCSAESGIFTDASMSGDSFIEHDFQRGKAVQRSDSVLSQTSLTSVTAEYSPNAIDTANRDQLSLTALPLCEEKA